MSPPAEISATGAEDALSPVKRALLEVRELRRRLSLAESQRDEPIAVIGMACRLPAGIDTPQAFWELLREGRIAIGKVPAARWDADALYDPNPDAAGKAYTSQGAFVSDVDRFDPYFFGIPPREAASMDPQQRLLLEVSWEALEDAGLDATALNGSSTGVFVGVSSNDYAILQARGGGLEDIDAYRASGVSHSVVAGRLSYFFGFHGPSIAIDTACSSSLVALHQACASLRQRECRLALAGGANLILVPDYTVNFCRARMLSRDGLCRTFDAGADGYVRGEGVVVIALKRLSDAQADGDRILAVIRGTAVNQDGRSTGLTVPNGPAQEAVIRQAVERAGIAPRDVQYVEAHGTGTPLGDPIEVQALAAALGNGRSADEHLLIGSVKTNIGHLEASAGLAGLMKVVLSLRHGEIPAHLHFHSPNPHIEWSRLPVEVTAQARRWREGRRIAGVSSFGFSGTNAHVILEAAPPTQASSSAARVRTQVLPLSARSPEALQALAEAYAARLGQSDAPDLDSVVHTAAAGRSHFAHRLAVVTSSNADAAAALRAHSQGKATAGVHAGHAGVRPGIAFLFTGQGAQYVGMGRTLYEREPVFRAILDQCAAALVDELPRPLLEVMFEPGAMLDQTQFTQPALYALEVALAQLWRSRGIELSVVIGHSVGEYAAACVAGVFSVEVGAKLIAARARLMQELPAGGTMLAIQGDEQGRVVQWVGEYADDVSLAALNAPGCVVVSGRVDVIEQLSRRASDAGLETRPLTVSHAFHSSLMQPMLSRFEQIAQQVVHREPELLWISNLSGEVFDWSTWSNRMGEYWRRHVREPVRFEQGIRRAAAEGISLFLEVGPQPVLSGLGRATLGSQATWIASLKRDQDAGLQMAESLARLYTAGARVNWSSVATPGTVKTELPTYPFQRQSYWYASASQPSRLAQRATHDSWQAALLAGERQSTYVPFDLNLDSFPAKWESLTGLSQAYMIATLRRMDFFTRAGDRYSAHDIVKRGAILPIYRKLIERWLERLVQAGLLVRSGESFVATAPLPDEKPEQWRELARRQFHNYPAMFDYVDLCGTKLVDVLTGRESALETLFPDGSNEITEGLYQTSVVARYYNEVVRAVVHSVAAGGSTSILEIGAGTGGTTSKILPGLPTAGMRYVFTDVSQLFLVQARKKFAVYDFVEYALFNAENSPVEQGFAPHSFDLIVAANVLHATPDLATTMRNVRSLLTSGGVLVMLETTEHPIWLDVSTGLIEGWQKFEDPVRHGHPLLDPAQWDQLLRECGFEASVPFPRVDTPLQILGQNVIVVRAPKLAVDAAAAQSGRPLQPTVAAGAEIDQGSAADLLEQLDVASSESRLEILNEMVCEEVCRVSGVDRAHRPAPSQGLKEFGVDSLMAVELRNRLATRLALQRKLTATLIFDYPTVAAIAGYLRDELLDMGPQGAATPAKHVTDTVGGTSSVADMDEAAAEALLLEKLNSL